MKKWMQIVAAVGMVAVLSLNVSCCAQKSCSTDDYISVESSLLDAVKYDAGAETLAVKFSSGAVGTYTGVPAKVYDELMAAESKGEYFTGKIRNTFEYQDQE